MKLNCTDRILDSLMSDIKKLNKYLEIYERWVDLKNVDDGICQFIKKNGFKRIAVYGVGHMGRNLCNELKKGGIKPVYLIDRNKAMIYEDYPMYTVQDVLPESDLVVITPVIEYEEVAEILKEKLDCPLLSLEDIIL